MGNLFIITVPETGECKEHFRLEKSEREARKFCENFYRWHQIQPKVAEGSYALLGLMMRAQAEEED